MNSLVKEIVRPFLETEPKKIALIPGGFKPVTLGHFYLVNEIANKPELDEVLVLVGHKTRDNITKEDSLAIWEIYKKYLPSKVTIKISDNPSPITDIHSIIKNNQHNYYYPVVGIRGEQDLGDLKRFDSLSSKFDNFKPIVINSDFDVSGTKARQAIADNNYELFTTFLPTELSKEDKQQVWDIVHSKKPLTENIDEQRQLLLGHIQSLTEYMIGKGMNIEPLPEVEFVDDDMENADNFFGKTAYYDPNKRVIVLYTCNRHPKDIMRSFAHEMIHHIQNLEGRLENIATNDTNEDGDLPEIEREAYENGNMTFRNWEDEIKESNLQTESPEKHNSPRLFHHKLHESISEIDLSGENTGEILGDPTNGKFTIGDITYVYEISKLNNPYNDGGSFYNITFHPEGNKTDEPTGNVGGGDYVRILNTMYKIINDFIVEYKPEYVGISSMDNDYSKNYHNIYNNLVKNNNIPGYFKKNNNLPFTTSNGAKGRFIVLKKSTTPLNEGRYDTLSNLISSEIFNKWKSDFDNGEMISTFEDDFENKDLYVDVNATMDFTLDNDKLTVDGGADSETDYLELNFEIDPNLLPEMWSDVSMNLKDVVRHEIEHLTHGEGDNLNPNKYIEDDTLIRDMINMELLSKSDYFKLEKEIDANLQGMYFRAKKEHRPLKDVMDIYLGSQGITPEEQEDILNIWRRRAKALSLPEF